MVNFGGRRLIGLLGKSGIEKECYSYKAYQKMTHSVGFFRIKPISGCFPNIRRIQGWQLFFYSLTKTVPI
jgi:hypothetical protein